jgi:hypothetical protein
MTDPMPQAETNEQHPKPEREERSEGEYIGTCAGPCNGPVCPPADEVKDV